MDILNYYGNYDEENRLIKNNVQREVENGKL